MDLSERIRIVLKENKLKQKEFANVIGVSESYISAIINKKTEGKNLSQSLAKLIEEKFGYSAHWILTGEEPKLKVCSKNPMLSETHKKAILQLEKMNTLQIKAIIAFMNSLDEVEKILKDLSDD